MSLLLLPFIFLGGNFSWDKHWQILLGSLQVVEADCFIINIKDFAFPGPLEKISPKKTSPHNSKEIPKHKTVGKKHPFERYLPRGPCGWDLRLFKWDAGFDWDVLLWQVLCCHWKITGPTTVIHTRFSKLDWFIGTLILPPNDTEFPAAIFRDIKPSKRQQGEALL